MRVSALILLVFFTAGCPGDDAPPMICPAVPFDCVDDCCSFSTPGTYVDCSQTCPPGLRAQLTGETCRPTGDCTDAAPPDVGRPDSGPDAFTCPDLPPLPPCLGGPCCEEFASPTIDPFSCEPLCPPGFDFECFREPLCDGETRCDQPSECVVIDRGCCPSCSLPGLDDVVGISIEDVDRYRESLCSEPVACPDCEPFGPNPALVPTCNARSCVAVDVSALPAAQCENDDECRLRTNTCCECDVVPNEANVVSITPLGVLDLLALVCDDSATCDACVPEYPARLEAFCNARGRCDVR